MAVFGNASAEAWAALLPRSGKIFAPKTSNPPIDHGTLRVRARLMSAMPLTAARGRTSSGTDIDLERQCPSILAKASPHRLVDHRFQVQLDPSTLCRRHHHEDSKHVVHGVDEIETAAGAVPTVFTEWPVRIRRRRGAHGEAKTEAAGGVRKIKGSPI